MTLPRSDGPLFIVLNAGSGSQDAAQTQAQIAALLDEAGRKHRFLPANGGGILAAAQQAVALAREQQGVVVAAGGDGTINAVAQATIAAGLPFAVLPQGTFNYFGRAHGISQDTAEAVHALLGATLRPVQAGLVNDRLFLVNASLGLYPKLLEDRELYKQQLGRSRLVAMLAGLVTLLREARQLDLCIEQDGEELCLRTPTLFVGNNRLQMEQIGIAEAPALSAGRLVAIMLRPIGSLRMLGLLLRGALGRLGDADTVTSFSLRSLTVRTRRPRRIKVATDGEVFHMNTPLQFRVAPQPLLLMAPGEADRLEPA
ncbi:diacylglycerol kinase [Solimonas sp. K1W22B-7]|uniref:diacylglycerol/lipid kinase family protein n=1 Tax=Solimonas sp. K1W22B-7 TaxID=2303331 RepID=UPI000E330F16|nr:diacylglycerol kinase family protein [Solimonas sp. K1W22B-7]AXQ28675.1 diacylglycerol kinase [Solimonas sp. K1W22B-7]